MIPLRSSKKGHHKAGKSFVLMFNRVSMYGPGHPYSVQAVEEFYRSIRDLLQIASPVVLIYRRGQFFLEDEPLDPSLNYFKMASHFKRAQVTSIAVFQDVQKREVEDFIGIFLDTRNYPTVDRIKAAAESVSIAHIRINHISYRKVSEDDRIVSKSTVVNTETLSNKLNASQQYQEALGMIAGKLLMEEVDQELCLKRLITDPFAYSINLVSQEVTERSRGTKDVQRPVYSISGHLAALGHEIKNVLSDGSGISLSDLAAALVKMKHGLQDAIKAQRSLGAWLDPSETVYQQAEDLSDTVILELIKKEYQHGRTPVARLAFLLQRIVATEPELRRLLPKIRDSLVAEGMPLSVFWELIQHLGQDRQNAPLAEWLHQGAEAIGMNAGDLMSRWKADPSRLTQFLYLATEIEQQAGSAQPLCDILVEYIERFKPKMINVGADPEATSGRQLRNLAALFNAQLVEGLRGQGTDSQLINQVEKRLAERLDASVQAIRTELAAYHASIGTQDLRQATLLQRLEEGLSDDQELKRILKEIRSSSEGSRWDENDFQQIFERIQTARNNRRKKIIALHDLIFNKEITFALLEKEISRSARYGTSLSGITFSVLHMAAPGMAPDNGTEPTEALLAFLQAIQQRLRTADWMGTLSHGLFIAVLPMTTVKEAHLTARRLMKHINSKPGAPPGPAGPAKLAGSVVHYDQQTIANADAFIRCASREHAEMIQRLRNLQEFM
jgi:hypothetical protein